MNDAAMPRGDAALAGRSVGAMFFSVFGGVWIGLWAGDRYPGSVAAMLAVAMLTIALAGAAYRVYRRHTFASKGIPRTPEARSRARRFHLVNGAQWVVILVAAFTLAEAGLQTWILPMVILVIGLHFFPLARLFGYRMHYGTGAALVLVAATYPFVAPDGPASASGPLAAGIILWLSAVLAISPLASRRGAAGARG